ncbi:hypothetical protein OVA24_20690 [Luteolibacter sp. SL250]|uniref:hypothetical protein n=1 Tax=Luteolibacter sp. SL250 TaxID=2995170 RepID=UPI00226FCE54|nr:hypothetical protein [Luteolibacter sp. SL250]WAC19641.1 hypothetical protein OVA24_20690 [Luteolibacter sp. SL250]
MKTNTSVSISPTAASVCAILAVGGLGSVLFAGESAKGGIPAAEQRGAETEMDLPTTFHKYYGQNANHYKDAEKKIAKIDVDGDLNYDGVVSNTDPGDNGAFEGTPPGLVLGVGEMSKLVLRLAPYRADFEGEVVVTLEVAGINRASKTGTFETFEDEQASTGRIRVWKDASKSVLLVDSGKSDRLVHEFIMDASQYPANLPGVVPRTFYVEGVRPSGEFTGDVRLLTTVSFRPHGSTAQSYAESRKTLLKPFRTSFDHMLFTVRSQPAKKDFINNNAEGVWIR